MNTPSRTIFRDPAIEAEFRENGFARTSLLSPKAVADLLGELSSLKPGDGFAPDGSSLVGNTYHCTFVDPNLDYKRAAFDLLAKHCSEPISRILADYRILAANFQIKQPGQGYLQLHQNWPVLELDETSVSVWCALVDVDEANGTLHVIPGSHKLVPHVESAGNPCFISDVMAEAEELLEPVSARAGEAINFDDSLLHGSPPNGSDAPRIAIQLTCIPKEASPVYFCQHSATHLEAVHADTDFYTGQHVSELARRSPDWKSVGFVENRNRQISIAELQDLIARGPQIRSEGFGLKIQPDAVPPFNANPAGAPTLRQRIRAAAGRRAPVPLKRLYRRLRGRPLTDTPPSPIRDARSNSAPHAVSDVRDYYEELTGDYLAGFGQVFQGSRPESTEELLDYLVDAAALEDGMTVLDAGCGVGGPAMGLAARRDIRVEGLTLARAQVERGTALIAERGLSDRITLRQGDFHQLDSIFPAEHFDRVLFLESICHAQDYAAVLRGAYRVLKPGGALYIKDFHCVDNRARPSMAAGQAADLAKLHDVYRLQMPDQASMVDVITGLGFMIRYMRMPDYQPTYTHWAHYEHVSGRGWHPTSAEPGDIIQAVEFLCLKR
ncbi:phytanoyl-CoA dioxygenase family protein [Novosphingobium sp. TH158]|uniref:phytanoyl-CoA dioxygenase family protein n=1 Tax=Novosphingobium sp. TH158 TaxID=2067455 RepID=UPI000C7A9E6E|nr:phytanoyl-CoA dioxygenase family protein [Novosphingobium sp. TH158]PLK26760.1 hypothetical protein C0V78_07555 [Novosphingobium sp. TH158]